MLERRVNGKVDFEINRFLITGCWVHSCSAYLLFHDWSPLKQRTNNALVSVVCAMFISVLFSLIERCMPQTNVASLKHYSFTALWIDSLVGIDPIGIALLIEYDSAINAPNSYPLLKTLLRRDWSSRLDQNRLELDIRLLELSFDDSGTTYSVALRANNALCFIGGHHRFGLMFDSFKELVCRNYVNDNRKPEFLLELLKALCRMGLTLNADTPPAYFFRQNSIHHLSEYWSHCFLEVLVYMFDMGFEYSIEDIKFYVSEWICNGWICDEKITDTVCLYSRATVPTTKFA